MTRHFVSEIEKLKKMILHLTAMVENSLMISVNAVAKRDDTIREKVQKIDNEIDAYEVEIEEECLKILALHQPVAADLRFVVAVLKINNDLERIGDLSLNLAKRVKDFAPYSDRTVPFDLPRMHEVTMKMVKQSSDALIAWDDKLARDICRIDNEVDDIHKNAYRVIKDKLKEEPDFSEYYLGLLSVSRNLERIADHATNIAEDIIYMVSGEIIRHQNSDAQ